jgi:hypothetical protein
LAAIEARHQHPARMRNTGGNRAAGALEVAGVILLGMSLACQSRRRVRPHATAARNSSAGIWTSPFRCATLSKKGNPGRFR